jgi:hypothetical protein
MCGSSLQLKIEVIEDLAELDHGEFSGLIDEEIDAGFPGERRRRAADKYRWRFPGGESYADADVRAARALDQLSRWPSRRPLVVSHEMIGRMLQRRLLRLDPQAALGGVHPHDVYLSAAQHHGAQIRTRCEVRGIRPLDGGGYEVTYTRHEDGRPPSSQRDVITCDRLILGAGAYGTTYLLLRNRAALLAGHVDQAAEATAEIRGAGVVHIRVEDFAHQLTTLRTTGRGRAEAVFEFGRFFLGQLCDVYGRHVGGALADTRT